MKNMLKRIDDFLLTNNPLWWTYNIIYNFMSWFITLVLLGVGWFISNLIIVKNHSSLWNFTFLYFLGIIFVNILFFWLTYSLFRFLILPKDKRSEQQQTDVFALVINYPITLAYKELLIIFINKLMLFSKYILALLFFLTFCYKNFITDNFINDTKFLEEYHLVGESPDYDLFISNFDNLPHESKLNIFDTISKYVTEKNQDSLRYILDIGQPMSNYSDSTQATFRILNPIFTNLNNVLRSMLFFKSLSNYILEHSLYFVLIVVFLIIFLSQIQFISRFLTYQESDLENASLLFLFLFAFLFISILLILSLVYQFSWFISLRITFIISTVISALLIFKEQPISYYQSEREFQLYVFFLTIPFSIFSLYSFFLNSLDLEKVSFVFVVCIMLILSLHPLLVKKLKIIAALPKKE